MLASHGSPVASASSSSQSRGSNRRTIRAGGAAAESSSTIRRDGDGRRETNSFASRLQQHRPTTKGESHSNHPKRRDIFSALAAAQTASSAAKQVSPIVSSSSSSSASKSQRNPHSDVLKEKNEDKQKDAFRRLTSISSALRKSIAPNDASEQSTQSKGKGVERKSVPIRPSSSTTTSQRVRRNIALELESRRLDNANNSRESVHERKEPSSKLESFKGTQRGSVSSDGDLTNRSILSVKQVDTHKPPQMSKRSIDEALKDLELHKRKDEETQHNTSNSINTTTVDNDTVTDTNNDLEKGAAANTHADKDTEFDLETEQSQNEKDVSDVPSPSRWVPPQQQEMVQLPARIESTRKISDRDITRRSSRSSLTQPTAKSDTSLQQNRLSVNSSTTQSIRRKSTLSSSSHRTHHTDIEAHTIESNRTSGDREDTQDSNAFSLPSRPKELDTSAEYRRLSVNDTQKMQRRESTLTSSSHQTQRTTATENTIKSANDVRRSSKPQTEFANTIFSIQRTAQATSGFDDNDVLMRPTDFDGLFEKMQEIKRQLQVVAKTSAIRPTESQLTKNMGGLTRNDPPRAVVISKDSIDERIQRAKRIIEESKQRSKMWFVRVPERHSLDYPENHWVPKKRMHSGERNEGREDDKLKKSRHVNIPE